MSRSIATPKGSELNLRRCAMLKDLLLQIGEGHSAVDAVVTQPQIDHSVVERPLTHCDPHRKPYQVGVGELLAGAEVAVVEQYVGTVRGKLVGGFVGLPF